MDHGEVPKKLDFLVVGTESSQSMTPRKKRISTVPVYKQLLEQLGPSGWWPAKTRFEVMVGAILTQNTSWKNVEKAIDSLKKNRLLSPDKLHTLEASQIAPLIRSSGYYNQKAIKLKSLLDWFGQYGFSIEQVHRKYPEERPTSLREEILSIRGVGPETADSILCYALDYPFFVVDAYTLRWMNRYHPSLQGLDYHGAQTIVEEDIRAMGGATSTVEHFNEFHALIVRLGNGFCKKRNPLCDEGCPLGKICQKLIES